MFKEKNLRKATVNERINTKGMEFHPLKEFLGQNVRIFGYFFTDGKFGKQVVAVTETELINLPKRYTEDFEKLTDEEIEAVKDGALVLANIRQIDTKNGTAIAFDYDDYIS